eukprot:9134029-Pyramimonas_sp.AAC.1
MEVARASPGGCATGAAPPAKHWTVWHRFFASAHNVALRHARGHAAHHGTGCVDALVRSLATQLLLQSDRP